MERPASLTPWQPIETAPKDGTVVDVWVQWFRDGAPKREFPIGKRVAEALFERNQWIDDAVGDPLEWGPDQYGQQARVTHWMPLPEPPHSPASLTPPQHGGA